MGWELSSKREREEHQRKNREADYKSLWKMLNIKKDKAFMEKTLDEENYKVYRRKKIRQ